MTQPKNTDLPPGYFAACNEVVAHSYAIGYFKTTFGRYRLRVRRMQQLKRLGHRLVTSHPVSMSLRIVMQVVILEKPLGVIGLRLDAVYERWMHTTKPKSSICLLVTSQAVSKSLRIVMQVVTSGKPLGVIGLRLDGVYER